MAYAWGDHFNNNVSLQFYFILTVNVSLPRSHRTIGVSLANMLASRTQLRLSLPVHITQPTNCTLLYTQLTAFCYL